MASKLLALMDELGIANQSDKPATTDKPTAEEAQAYLARRTAERQAKAAAQPVEDEEHLMERVRLPECDHECEPE